MLFSVYFSLFVICHIIIRNYKTIEYYAMRLDVLYFPYLNFFSTQISFIFIIVVF